MRDDSIEWCLLHHCTETIPACEPDRFYPDLEDYNDPYDDDVDDGDGDE